MQEKKYYKTKCDLTTREMIKYILQFVKKKKKNVGQKGLTEFDLTLEPTDRV